MAVRAFGYSAIETLQLPLGTTVTNDLIPQTTFSAVVADLYKDLIHPSAARVGYSLEAITKVALSPVALLDWGFEQSKDWLKEKIRARLDQTPPEFVKEPSANIAFTALSHIARSSDTPELREFYAELLLKAMDTRTSSSVHAAYFYIVEQLAPHEALVLGALHQLQQDYLFSESSATDRHAEDKKGTIEKQFRSFCMSILAQETDQAEIWLTNLCRLGILVLQASSEAVFRPEEADRHGVRAASVDNYEHRLLSFTQFGRAFITACAPQA